MKNLFRFMNLDAVDSDSRPDKTFKNLEKQSRNKERFNNFALKAVKNEKVISSRFGYSKTGLNLKRVPF